VTTRLAAIDLGTVTSRLLIADVTDDGICELERHMRITHLGEGLSETGVIGAAALERERAACRDFLAAIRAVEQREGRAVERVIAVATSAMRDARNSDEVCDALAEEGLEVEVITGIREARLSFSGTLSGFSGDGVLSGGGVLSGDGTMSEGGAHGEGATCNASAGKRQATGQPVLTVDVGGGSTELICGVLEGSQKPHILSEHSFDIGSRRLTDHFLAGDPPSVEDMSRAGTWVRDQMREYFTSLEQRPELMIAVAGTATSVVSVRDRLAQYDPWKVHGSRVSAAELDKVLYDLAKLDLRQRERCVGLEPGRAPVILGGLITLRVVQELAGLDSFVVSETDILQGILLDAASRCQGSALVRQGSVDLFPLRHSAASKARSQNLFE
jgi:exopolyphosphatase/guanosine-5'-triphosphate,3'-diphosphate pyrophosphatase